MYKAECTLVISPMRRIITNVLIFVLRFSSYLMLKKNKTVLLVSSFGESLGIFFFNLVKF